MIRVVVRGVGKSLIGAGVLILLFVAYELWGTNFAEARSQRALKQQFEALLTAPTTRPTIPPPTVPGAPPPAPPDTSAPPPPQGEAVAIIKIPRLGLEKAVVEGVGVENLKKGPGHYPKTPLPGQPGNSAIAGHRTTYGAPFNRIDELANGDPIIVTTRQGRFRYEVFDRRVVKPGDVSVLDPTRDNRLTLTTCNPKYSASQRLIVFAHLVGPAAEAPPPPPVTTPPSTVPGVSIAPTTAPRILPEAGLSGTRAPKGPALLWGLLAALVAFGAWLAGRRWRRWLAYLLGAPVFLVVLYVFFENVARLLPANI